MKKRVVFKVGTSTLAYSTGNTNIRHMGELVRVLSDVKNSGVEVVLVTSGAIGIGVGKLGLPKKPDDTPGRQAAASVGQCELMFMYDKLFSDYGHTIGQVLITKADFDDEKRYENLKNTFLKLFMYGVIPVINENDCVGVEEIVFGDNDTLSAVVARSVSASDLVILTDINGLYSDNPKTNKAAKLISDVYEITDDLKKTAQGAGSTLGTGGMITKLHAAEIATESGIDTYIINSTPISNIYDLMEGKSVGTHIYSREKRR